MIHSNSKWDAEVVYGDTDSLFVYVPGRTRDEAFDIGEDIADTITRMNPRPIKLKFEKVFHPLESWVINAPGLPSMCSTCEEKIRRFQIRETDIN